MSSQHLRHMRCCHHWHPWHRGVRTRGGGCHHHQLRAAGSRWGKECGKGMVLYSAVSSPLDRLKRFTLSSPGRPVHSDTVLGFSWKHSSHAAIAQRLFTHMSTTVYSQVLIYTAESTEASWSERKCPNFETVTTGIRTRALSIASPAFYQLSYRAPQWCVCIATIPTCSCFLCSACGGTSLWTSARCRWSAGTERYSTSTRRAIQMPSVAWNARLNWLRHYILPIHQIQGIDPECTWSWILPWSLTCPRRGRRHAMGPSGGWTVLLWCTVRPETRHTHGRGQKNEDEAQASQSSAE